MTLTMDEVKTISAQQKWAASDIFDRQLMLRTIGESTSYATTSWKRLPYLVKVNLDHKPWTA